MSNRLYLLILAMFCAFMVVATDLEWFGLDSGRHVAAWLGFALLFYMAREVKS